MQVFVLKLNQKEIIWVIPKFQLVRIFVEKIKREHFFSHQRNNFIELKLDSIKAVNNIPSVSNPNRTFRAMCFSWNNVGKYMHHYFSFMYSSNFVSIFLRPSVSMMFNKGHMVYWKGNCHSFVNERKSLIDSWRN